MCRGYTYRGGAAEVATAGGGTAGGGARGLQGGGRGGKGEGKGEGRREGTRIARACGAEEAVSWDEDVSWRGLTNVIALDSVV